MGKCYNWFCAWIPFIWTTCAAVLAFLLSAGSYLLLPDVSPLTEAWTCKTANLQTCKTAKLQNCKTAKLQNWETSTAAAFKLNLFLLTVPIVSWWKKAAGCWLLLRRHVVFFSEGFNGWHWTLYQVQTLDPLSSSDIAPFIKFRHWASILPNFFARATSIAVSLVCLVHWTARKRRALTLRPQRLPPTRKQVVRTISGGSALFDRHQCWIFQDADPPKVKPSAQKRNAKTVVSTNVSEYHLLWLLTRNSSHLDTLRTERDYQCWCVAASTTLKWVPVGKRRLGCLVPAEHAKHGSTLESPMQLCRLCCWTLAFNWVHLSLYSLCCW